MASSNVEGLLSRSIRDALLSPEPTQPSPERRGVAFSRTTRTSLDEGVHQGSGIFSMFGTSVGCSERALPHFGTGARGGIHIAAFAASAAAASAFGSPTSTPAAASSVVSGPDVGGDVHAYAQDGAMIRCSADADVVPFRSAIGQQRRGPRSVGGLSRQRRGRRYAHGSARQPLLRCGRRGGGRSRAVDVIADPVSQVCLVSLRACPRDRQSRRKGGAKQWRQCQLWSSACDCLWGHQWSRGTSCSHRLRNHRVSSAECGLILLIRT